jgi:hypothetical protein
MKVAPCQATRMSYDGGNVNFSTHEVWGLCAHASCTDGRCCGALGAEDPDLADVTRLGSVADVEAHFGAGSGKVLIAPHGVFSRQSPPAVGQLAGTEPLPDGCKLGVTSKSIARKNHSNFPLSSDRQAQLDRVLVSLTYNVPEHLRYDGLVQRWRTDLYTLARRHGADTVETKLASLQISASRGLGPLLDELNDQLNEDAASNNELRARVGKTKDNHPIVATRQLCAIKPAPGQRPTIRLRVGADSAFDRSAHFSVRWYERVVGMFDSDVIREANTTAPAAFKTRHGHLRSRATSAFDPRQYVEDLLNEGVFTHGLNEAPISLVRRSTAGPGAAPIPTSNFMVRVPSPFDPDHDLLIIATVVSTTPDCATVMPVTVLKAPSANPAEQREQTVPRQPSGGRSSSDGQSSSPGLDNRGLAAMTATLFPNRTVAGTRPAGTVSS